MPSLAEMLDPEIETRGSILPFGLTRGGGYKFAVPGSLVDMLLSMERGGKMAVGDEPLDPNAVTDAALNVGMMGSVVGSAPAGALGANIARRGKNSLPMDEASRMARAREMGFDTGKIWYRGTVNRGEKKASHSLEATRGVFMSDNPDVAKIFRYPREYGEVLADSRAGDFQKLYTRSQKPLTLTAENAQKFTDDTSYQTGVIRDAIDKGYDSILVPNVREGVGDWVEHGTTLVVLDPRMIRKTSAAFDPAKKDSANLLAMNPTAAGIPGLAEMLLADR
jgi:hypothetical protein